MQRERLQKGNLILNQNGTKWFLRYRISEIVNGQEVRKQRYEFLCNRDAEHDRKSAKALKQKVLARMTEINGQKPSEHLSVDAFWQKYYIPWAQHQYRKSTFSTAMQNYKQYIKPRIGEMALADLRPGKAQLMLEELGRKYTMHTLARVKQVCTSIFRRAVVHELIETNPWLQINLGEIKAKTSPNLVGKRQPFYSINETMAVLHALGNDTEAKLVFALSAIMALRPEESSALMWSDISGGQLFIQRTCVKGDIQGTKTDAATDKLPLIGPVKSLLAQWCSECQEQPWWPANGWMFPDHRMRPLRDIQQFARKRIRDVIVPKGLPWKSLYAGRRGAATAIIDLANGNYHSGQELLRHSNANTTLRSYKQTTGNNLRDAIGLFEQRLLEAATQG